MIAAVTGGSGFIGRNLVQRLLTDGYEVRCLIRRSTSRRSLPADVSTFVVDLDDVESLRSCAGLRGVDVVFHLAGATKALTDSAFIRANVDPTRHLLTAVADRETAPRFVFVSSQAAAGPATALDHPIAEQDPPRPVEAYGRSKLEAERVVEAFSERLPTVIVRPCAVLGPHDRDFLRLYQVARLGLVVYPGTASAWLSILHVHDVVDGIVAAGTRDAARLRTYFLSSPAPVQWRALGALIADAVAVRARHIDLPPAFVRAVSAGGQLVGSLVGRALLANTHKAALSRYPFWVCSAARAERELGFTPALSLPAAVRDTYLWYVEHGWLHGSHPRAATLA